MKSILIIDTPLSCNDCPLRVMESDLYYTNFACQNESCITDDSREMTRLEMNCPLKPLPKRYIKIAQIENGIVKNNEEIQFMRGWNACIDEILGD